MTTPSFTINGLSPLALRIAMFLHGASGIVRMETIRAVARALNMADQLPQALQQLQEMKQAEVCPWCDALVTGCEDRWCRSHGPQNAQAIRDGELGEAGWRAQTWRTRHTPDCPKSGRMPTKAAVVAHSRRHA